MIGFVYLSFGIAGTAACAYYVAPAARGLHRHVLPKSSLRADAARLDAENASLACDIGHLLIQVQAARRERDDNAKALRQALERIGDLEQQLANHDETQAENLQLSADLANARAMRQKLTGPSPADDASALPDYAQEFANQTASAWRASA
ncbi:hypothetical protein AB0D27_11185 [Streptomyces sp. NPDC048415]|uniref:hypothetical protein n=1 Tax=Streptomyces sp. NPDC048415 TaxID=3154822 RepID=UPI00341F8ABE